MMKHARQSIFVLLLLLISVFYANAEQSEQDVEINSKTGFPEIKAKPYVAYDWGACYNLITRIQLQQTRSNFVYQDHLFGLFFGLQTYDMKPLNSMARVSVYMPFYKTFNGMEQKSKQSFLYGFDAFYGIKLDFDMWKYVRFDFAAGPHLTYELTDAYHLVYLGGEVLVRMELPISTRWTILMDANFSLDYANCGTNSSMQPFEIAYQYQYNLGARYSKKSTNQYSYLHSKPKTSEQLQKDAEKEAEKKAKFESKKVEKESAKAQKEASLAAKKKEKEAKL